MYNGGAYTPPTEPVAAPYVRQDVVDFQSMSFPSSSSVPRGLFTGGAAAENGHEHILRSGPRSVSMGAPGAVRSSSPSVTDGNLLVDGPVTCNKARALRLLLAALRPDREKWPVTWDRAKVVADMMSKQLDPTLELGGLIRSEIDFLEPRYNNGGRGPGVCGPARVAENDHASKLSAQDFADLYARAFRRLGPKPMGRMNSRQGSLDRLYRTPSVSTGFDAPGRGQLPSKSGSLECAFGRTLRVGRLGVVRLCRRHMTGDANDGKATICVSRSVARQLLELGHRGKASGRLQDELEVLRGLDHPHVVRLLDSMDDEAHMHLFFQQISGGNLHEALSMASQGHGITEAWVATLILQLNLAIGYCHMHRVLHRNLTPRKIMLRGWSSWGSAPIPAPLPHLVLLDAGLVEALVPAAGGSSGHATHRPYGTPLFMAPEVFLREYGPACDIWSIGVMTFVLMSGQFPFEASDALLLEELVTGPNQPLPLPATSGEAVELCAALLVKDPAYRPRTSDVARQPWFSTAQGRFERLPTALYEKAVKMC